MTNTIKSRVETATLPVEQLVQFPEFENLEAFIESKFLDEDFDVHVWELRALSQTCQMTLLKLRGKLQDEGFSFVPQGIEKVVRGMLTGSHDRWYGPGSCPSHGGSGWEQITKFAGQSR